MAQLAERQSTYLSRFEAFRLDASFGSGEARAAREAAFARFLAKGFPTTRDEEWRFTSVAPIAATPFEPAAPTTLSTEAIAPFLFDSLIAHRVVVVNGRYVPALSTAALPAGVTVRAGADLVPAAEPRAHVFVDLNTAFQPGALVIDVAPKAVVTGPLHLLFVAAGGATPALVSPRVVINVGEQAQVAIVEHYVSGGRETTLTNVVVDMRLSASAIVDHVKFQQESETSFHLASTFVHLARAATFTSQAITLGGRIARNDIVSVLDGEGAECTLNGVYVATGDSLVDTHTVIDHAKAHCPSHEAYRGILTGKSRAVFNGKIIVRPDAQKTDAKQTNKALLLTADAQINTKPQLEIFADDVKCTHGATIGQLDQDAMFYLRARGISTEMARNMLIHAFAGQVLDGVKVAAVRNAATRLMEEKLAL
jgi:Fe-S cluster assembly protein SufD